MRVCQQYHMSQPDHQTVLSSTSDSDAINATGKSTVTGAGLWRTLLQEGLQVVLPALTLALTVHLFLAQATIVYGQSMEPNLYERQRLIIDKISYRLHPPHRNDIVVLDMPGMNEMLVKRVIALPGETVKIDKGVVYVDGATLPEPFPHDIRYSKHGSIHAGAAQLFRPR